MNTLTPVTKNPNDTSTSTNFEPSFRPYNRKVWRYAKKHKLTVEQAFKRLYK